MSELFSFVYTRPVMMENMIHFFFGSQLLMLVTFYHLRLRNSVDDVSHSNGYKICYQVADCLRIIANQTFFLFFSFAVVSNGIYDRGGANRNVLFQL